jgi:hypothetical protein
MWIKSKMFINKKKRKECKFRTKGTQEEENVSLLWPSKVVDLHVQT